MERTLRDEYEPMLRAIMDCPVPTIQLSTSSLLEANLALVADVVIGAHSSYLMQVYAHWSYPRCWWHFCHAAHNGLCQSDGCILVR